MDHNRKDDAVIEQVKKRLDDHIVSEEKQREQILTELKSIRESTAELVEAWTNAKGAIAVIRITGNVLKWMSIVIVPVVVAWYTLTGRTPPTIGK